MADVVDSATRSRMMAGIRATNTRIEIMVRKALHAQGFRYRLHPRGVPGKPDAVFPRFHAVLFVNGCFWHGHDCPMFRVPATRQEFWASKFARNRLRDNDVRRQLRSAGWRVLTVWECALRGRGAIGLASVTARAAAWLRGNEDNKIQKELAIRGSS